MSKARTGNVINTVITIIVSLLLLGVVGGLIAWLARSEGLTVYVEYGEKRYTVNDINNSLGTLNSGEHTFTVGSLSGETVDYAVVISVNRNKNFEFVARDKLYKWTSVDCSQYFGISRTDNGFTLYISETTTVSNFLRSAYGDFKYTAIMPNTDDYFVMTVKMSHCEMSFPFGIAVGDTPYTDEVTAEVRISPDNIMF